MVFFNHLDCEDLLRGAGCPPDEAVPFESLDPNNLAEVVWAYPRVLFGEYDSAECYVVEPLGCGA